VAVLSQPDWRLVVPALVITEVSFLVERRLGALAEAAFVGSLHENDVRMPPVSDWLRIAELVQQYADFPLGAVDASIVALAERLNTDILITLDRRHFAAVRPRHCQHFRLLP
jgi:predicted nucleic acid-binding protein